MSIENEIKCPECGSTRMYKMAFGTLQKEKFNDTHAENAGTDSYTKRGLASPPTPFFS
jgi:hypothetical protein